MGDAGLITAKIKDVLINCYDGSLHEDLLRRHSSSGEIKCPACGGVYEYCNGEFVSAYFRHKSKDECDRFSEPETEEHRYGKQKLYEWISAQSGVTDVTLEGWVPETRQRPDIIFTYMGRRYVIEYQCSPIATEWVERTSLYESVGLIPIWILGTKNYLWYRDNSGSKSKRFKKIEEHEPIYFDSDMDILLCGMNTSKLKLKYSFVNESIGDLTNCIAKWGVGTLCEKIDLVCSDLSNFKFDKAIIHDVSANDRYLKVLNRLVSLRQEMYDMCESNIESSFPNSKFEWIDCCDSIKISDRKVARCKVDDKHTLEIIVWYDLDKYGIDWRVSIGIRKMSFETEYMSTDAFRVYLDKALHVRARQIMRRMDTYFDRGAKKWVSREDYNMHKPYEYNKVREQKRKRKIRRT